LPLPFCRSHRIVVAIVPPWYSTHHTIVLWHPPDLHHSHHGAASSDTASPICIIATIHETARVEPNEDEDKVGRRGLMARSRHHSTMCGHGSPSIMLSWLFSTRCQLTLLWAAAPPQLLGTGEKQWSPWRRCHSTALLWATSAHGLVVWNLREERHCCCLWPCALSFSFVR
jgi:hypothetical protein